MEFASELMPIILFMLLSVLVVVVIVLVYKMIITLDKVNKIMDDVSTKVHKLDGLFEIVDRSADTISMFTDKVTGFISYSLFKIFKKKRKDDFDE